MEEPREIDAAPGVLPALDLDHVEALGRFVAREVLAHVGARHEAVVGRAEVEELEVDGAVAERVDLAQRVEQRQAGPGALAELVGVADERTSRGSRSSAICSKRSSCALSVKPSLSKVSTSAPAARASSAVRSVDWLSSSTTSNPFSTRSRTTCSITSSSLKAGTIASPRSAAPERRTCGLAVKPRAASGGVSSTAAPTPACGMPIAASEPTAVPSARAASSRSPSGSGAFAQSASAWSGSTRALEAHELVQSGQRLAGELLGQLGGRLHEPGLDPRHREPVAVDAQREPALVAAAGIDAISSRPHPDVASGRYQQAEFAADLWQVYRGEGSDEYRDPVEFFRRTFSPRACGSCSPNALQRLAGQGRRSGRGVADQLRRRQDALHAGALSPVLRQAGVGVAREWSRCCRRRASRSPRRFAGPSWSARPSPRRTRHRKPDGTVVAHPLGRTGLAARRQGRLRAGAEADERGSSPGSDVLRDLFNRAVAVPDPDRRVGGLRAAALQRLRPARRLVRRQPHLRPGAERSGQSCAGTLWSSSASRPRTSRVGGEGGSEALERLKNTFGRVETSWRPASAEEGFEIVRRRLFQPITDPHNFVSAGCGGEGVRGDVPEATSASSRPSAAKRDYERRMQAAYPIHPELFDRLYHDWSTLDKFQRTRGVLRLMAAVIHGFGSERTRSLLIMPASVPVDAPVGPVRADALPGRSGCPVIEKDVDGPNSLPLQLDRENPNLGRYSACRRVARTLYLGSAPTLNTREQGPRRPADQARLRSAGRDRADVW